MLAVERDAIKWTAYTDALGIQEREMAVITSYLQNLGNQAALIAGFSLTCYTDELSFPSDTTHPALEGFYFCCVTMSISMMLFCVVASTLVASLGPEKGLRGKDSTSMRVAVDHMKASRAMIRTSFGVGCTSFIAAIFQLLWLKISYSANSSICTALCAGLFWYLFRTVRAIFFNFTGEDSRPASTNVDGPGQRTPPSPTPCC